MPFMGVILCLSAVVKNPSKLIKKSLIIVVPKLNEIKLCNIFRQFSILSVNIFRIGNNIDLN